MFKKILQRTLLFILAFVLLFAGYLFIGKASRAEEINWGVNFSQKHTENLGLGWKETYSALLDDLKVKNIKLITHWDLIEPEENKYNFADLDWQVKAAEEKEANLLLVVGMKTGRWPECHEPDWVKNQNSKIKMQNSLSKYLERVVNRYKDSKAVWAWQVENEPFFPFGQCPKIEKKFVRKEIELVKSLDDKKRPIIISDSGEFSFWLTAAKLGDMVGTTLHRKVWFKELRMYISYPLPSVFYWRKAQIIKKIFNKEVIVGELQAEPWCSQLLYDCSLEEQKKTMSLEQFQKNTEFAKRTGLRKFYLWGAEWWYWLKEKQGQPQIWQAAKKFFEI